MTNAPMTNATPGTLSARKKQRNLALLAVMLGFVVLVYAITIIKIRMGATG